LDTLLPTLATKADVSDAKSGIVMWLSGVILAATAIIISVMTFMLNRAVPVQAATQQSPIIVYPAPPVNPPAAQPPLAAKP
jgi:hypothetical protein